MAEVLPNHRAPVLSRAITNVCKHYYLGGFVVHLMLMDMEFEKIKEGFTAVEVNTTATWEHVAKIERAIRFDKERLMCVVSTLRNTGVRYYHRMIIKWCVLCDHNDQRVTGTQRDFSRNVATRDSDGSEVGLQERL